MVIAIPVDQNILSECSSSAIWNAKGGTILLLPGRFLLLGIIPGFVMELAKLGARSLCSTKDYLLTSLHFSPFSEREVKVVFWVAH